MPTDEPPTPEPPSPAATTVDEPPPRNPDAELMVTEIKGSGAPVRTSDRAIEEG